MEDIYQLKTLVVAYHIYKRTLYISISKETLVENRKT